MQQDKKHMPPRWANRFLEWYCSPRYIDEIQGDLHEAFYRRCAEQGPVRARLLFVLDVMRSISFRTIEAAGGSPKFTMAMFGNYVTVAYRSLMRNKLFSLINISGLAIGLAACFLIVQYVLFEMSYDRFHPNADNVYRVLLHGKNDLSAATYPGIGPALEADFPEVEESARMLHQSLFLADNIAVTYDDGSGNIVSFNENRLYDVDPSFLRMFSFSFVYGDSINALSKTGTLVISETLSRKFFGDQNPIGKTLHLLGRFPFTISGVFKDVPENSHVQFNILMASWMQNRMENDPTNEGLWKWQEYYTYIRLNSRADPKELEAKLSDFMRKYLGDRMNDNNGEGQIELQPLTDIHLRSPNLIKERDTRGNASMVYFLLIVAIMILAIGWINYVNLSTSNSARRAREVGLRKIAGATHRQLVLQFLFEAAIVNSVALLLTAVIVALALPYFTQLTGKDISVNIHTMLVQPRFWIAVLAINITGAISAGLYPAFVLSSFKITNVLKGKLLTGVSTVSLRKALVGTQFVISVGLIAGTIIVYKQVSFMRNNETGYAKDQLLVVKSPMTMDTTFYHKLTLFKTELRSAPDVRNVTTSSEVPGKLISMLNHVRKRDQGPEEDFTYYQFFIDKDFVDTYGLKILAGRNFRESDHLPDFNEVSAQPVPVIVNERVVELLGYDTAEDAVDQLITYGLGSADWTGVIIGVTANHHQRSLRQTYDPILFFHVTKPTSGLTGQYITINLNMQHPEESLTEIRDGYAKVFPDKPFEYFFLDDYFNRQYAADQRFGKVFGLFSGLAIIVACLGLFGLSTFMISQRTKEIAVRKVLGATIPGMVSLFSRDFVKLTLLANLIALPLVYIAAQQWLSGFAFHTNMGWVVFLVPAILLLIISVATVAVQTVKTGLANPTECLRSE